LSFLSYFEAGNFLSFGRILVDLIYTRIHVVNHAVSETSFSGRIRVVKNQDKRLRSRWNIFPENSGEMSSP